jgi:hypothetical protein
MTRDFGILRGRGDTWGTHAPDLPGCHGGGDTAEAAIADVISAAHDRAEHRTPHAGANGHATRRTLPRSPRHASFHPAQTVRTAP